VLLHKIIIWFWKWNSRK